MKRAAISPIFVCADTAASLCEIGHVYVIAGASGHVKIGVSKNPKRRLYGLRNASPDALNLRFSMKVRNPYSVERAAHEAIAKFRVRGEWFLTSPSLAIRAVKAAAGDDVSRRTLADHVTFHEMAPGWKEAFSRIFQICPATAEKIDPSVAGVLRMIRAKP